MDFYSKSLNADDEEIVQEASPFIVEKGVLIRHVGKEGSLIIPKEVHTIGKNAFKGHAPINQVVIPRTVKVIKDGAFDDFEFKGIRYAGDLSDWCEMEIGDTELFGSDVEFRVLSEPIEDTLVIPDGVKRIRARVFKNLCNVKEVVLPNGLESIEKEAFDSAPIESINLPSSLKKIGEAAFNWTDLYEVTIPGGVKEIEADAFSQCTNLESVTIEEGVEKIGDNAFENTAIEEITFPKSLRRIGEDAFNETNLHEIDIPEKVQTVERRAFAENYNLTGVHLCNGVKEVDDKAFENCDRLKEVSFPGTLTYIGKEAFKGCSSLKKVQYYGTGGSWSRVQKQKPWFDGKSLDVEFIEVKVAPAAPVQQKKPTISVDKWAAAAIGAEIKDSVLVSYHGNGGSVRVPAGVLEIAEDAFAGNQKVTEVILPAGLTTIGANAFGGCEKLVTVSFPKSLKQIGWGAFADCSSLQKITYAGSEIEWFDVSRALFWDARTGTYTMKFNG